MNEEFRLESLQSAVFQAAVIDALKQGCDIFKDAKAGTSRINQYHYTDIENRMLSASVFTAFDEFDWNICGFRCMQQAEGSSHRSHLESSFWIIDIVRDGRRNAKFYEERYKRNLGCANDERRYAFISYSIEGDSDRLSHAAIVVPKSKKSNLFVIDLI